MMEDTRFFGQISEDMTELGVQELTELGAVSIEASYRGIYFSATPEVLYRIVYCTRLFSRILAPIGTFRCRDTDELYRASRKIDWTQYLNSAMTFAIFANVGNSRITHSHFAALRLKDAVVDSFRQARLERPNVDRDNPDLWLNLFINGDQAVINLDLSGGPLHRRGYRREAGEAPLRETLAAAFIRLSGWDGEKPLHDPMCGSGTIIHEALMHYCRIPAGYLRECFGFMKLPDFRPALWKQVRKEMDAAIRPLPENLIFGSDADVEAIRTVQRNGRNLPHAEKLVLQHFRFQDLPLIQNAVIISNPPYGLRLAKESDSFRLASELGDFLKQRCTGSTAYIYFGDRELIKNVGLRTRRKVPLNNGGLDGRLVQYDLY